MGMRKTRKSFSLLLLLFVVFIRVFILRLRSNTVSAYIKHIVNESGTNKKNPVYKNKSKKELMKKKKKT